MIVYSQQLSEKPTHEQLDDRLRGLMLEKAAMEKLTKTPGWEAYSRLVKANADTLKTSLEMNAFDSVKAVFTDQFVKGIANGLLRSLDLVQASTAAYDEEIRLVVSQMEELDGSSTEHPDSGSNSHDTSEPELPGFESGSDALISAP